MGKNLASSKLNENPKINTQIAKSPLNRSLKSLDVTDNFTIYAVVFLASSVLSLISFAGIGVREMLFLQASKWFSFQPEISVSASLLFTMITAFFSLFGVIFQLRKLNLTLSDSQE